MHITAFTRAVVVAAVSATVAFTSPALAQQSRVLKMQSAVPPATTSQDAFRFFADRVDKLTNGQLKIDALPGGAIVPPFEILDATHKKVIDGAYGISYWWFGKNKAATLFANTPAGIAGMDAIDFIGWLYDGGGLELWNEFYQKELKLNLVAFPSIPPSPQALGWFKRPIKDLTDFKGMKCRQTGIVAELYSKMGMAVVNMPGGEILPAAERGTIDCEAIKSASSETFLRWWATWQRQNADAIAEFVEKHNVKLLTTPPEINRAFLKVWDEFAAAESAKNPFFKKVYESQRAYAAKVVPAKRFMFPPYSFQADYYYPLK
jgi:TRAP-type mannitol/chloroaromatic compound transport system substrate-binding protein